jgi:stage V sporulation protein G
MNIQITEITIHPTNEDLVRAYVSIVFDNCFMVGEIRVMQGLTGLFVLFPAKRQKDGSDRQLAYPANAETRNLFQRVILAEYEKLVGKEDPVPSLRSASERLRALEQLKTDGLIKDEKYNTKRKEILGEL